MRLLMFALLPCLLTGCRSVLKNKSSADSTVSRSQQQNEKFTREIIREYLPGRHDTVYQHSVSTIEVPRAVTVDRPVLVRERILETGERQQETTEQKQVTTEEKEVKKEPLPWWVFVSIGVGGMLILLLIAGVLYAIVKIRGISRV